MRSIIQKLGLVIAVLWVSPSGFAYNFEVDGICYNITSEVDQTLEVTANSEEYHGNIEIPSTVIYGDRTFTVTSIGNDAFNSNYGLKSVTMPNSVITIGFQSFNSCKGLTSVIIPNSVISIGDYAFDSCYGLTSLTIGNSVETIGNNAFQYCIGLTSLTVPNSVTSIGSSAFAKCTSLTSLSIGNSVAFIGDGAFDNCNGLTSVTVPGSVTDLSRTAFQLCTKLEAINVEPDNPVYRSCDGVVYNKELTVLFCGPFNKKSVTVPNTVTTIGYYAFESCRGLTSVSMPNSVASIEDGAFSGCSGLTSVTIPNSVTSIGDWSFFFCEGLETIYSQMVEPVICYPYFSDDNYSNATLYVPIGALSAYKNVDPWSNFLNIEEIDFSGVDGIEAAGDSKTEVGRYNLHGVEVGDDYKGLIVIKYSDGTCCKKYSY